MSKERRHKVDEVNETKDKSEERREEIRSEETRNEFVKPGRMQDLKKG